MRIVHELTRELRYDMAAAVARHRERARRLDPENRAQKWLPLSEAVTSDVPFFVTVRDSVLALDFDRSDARDAARSAYVTLLIGGFAPVLIRSGGPDRWHVFAWVGARRMAALASLTEKGDVRATIRPPGARHRRGGRSQLEEPRDPAEALARLKGMSALRALGPTGVALAARSQPRSDRTKSDEIFAFALAAVNARWSIDDFLLVVRASGVGFGEIWAQRSQENGKQKTLEWLRRWVWPEVMEFAKESPPRSPRGIAREDRIFLSQVLEFRWPSRTGATDVRVLCGLLSKRVQCGTQSFDMSTRDLAVASGISSMGTLSASVKRLDRAGWLRFSKPSGYEAFFRAATWELLPRDTQPEPISVRRFQTCLQAVQHDAFRNRLGLGGGALLTFVQVVLRGGASIEDIERGTGRGARTIRADLATLEAFGLVYREQHRWLWREGDFDVVAKEAGSIGRGDRQKLQHELQRQGRTDAVKAYPNR